MNMENINIQIYAYLEVCILEKNPLPFYPLGPVTLTGTQVPWAQHWGLQILLKITHNGDQSLGNHWIVG